MADTLEELREQLRKEQQVNGGSSDGAPLPTAAPVNPLTNFQNQAAASLSDTSRAANGVSSGSGFDIDDIPELEYNLGPKYGGRGVVPEPTRARYNKFARRITKLGARSAEVAELLANADEKQMRENPELLEKVMAESEQAEAEMRAAVAELCNGHPTKKQINDLPQRHFLRFYNWLSGELNPEG